MEEVFIFKEPKGRLRISISRELTEKIISKANKVQEAPSLLILSAIRKEVER